MGGGGGGGAPTSSVYFLCRTIQSLVGHAVQIVLDSNVVATPKT